MATPIHDPDPISPQDPSIKDHKPTKVEKLGKETLPLQSTEKTDIKQLKGKSAKRLDSDNLKIDDVFEQTVFEPEEFPVSVFMVAMGLSEEATIEVQGQLDLAMAFIDSKREKLIQKAKNSPHGDGILYLRPSDYKQEGKSPPFLLGLKAKYHAAHIHVNADGRIFIIPKHPDLKLGKGHFKKVRAAIEYSSPGHTTQIVAYASMSAKKQSKIAMAKREVDLINKVLEKEPGQEKVIMKVYDERGITKRKVKTVLPYANLGNLKNIYRNKDLERKERYDLMMSCIDWVSKMHRENIVIADIKPANFLASLDKEKKITVFVLDLGLSYLADESTVKKQKVGTGLFLAPEVAREEILIDGKKADIYALGLTLYQLNSNKGIPYKDTIPPFAFVRRPAGKRFICTRPDRDEYIKSWNAYKPQTPFETSIKQMMHPVPEERPTLEEIQKKIDRLFTSLL